jgi:AcrR family transcriptional regulator
MAPKANSNGRLKPDPSEDLSGSQFIRVVVNDKLYLRDPQETELGRKILQHSVTMIDNLGFEEFTFAKLAHAIQSTETSIYRYFENKHNLLIYLLSWYWLWLEYLVLFKTNNITKPADRLKTIVAVMCKQESSGPFAISLLDEVRLKSIVMNEFNKVYLTKQVDAENNEGFFKHYKSFVKTVAKAIADYAPNYPYCNSLAAMVVDESTRQLYFAHHLPSLTDIQVSDNMEQDAQAFLEHIINSATANHRR